MKPLWWFAAVGATAAVVAAVWPLSPALLPREALQARLYAITVTSVACAIIALSKGVHSALWAAVAVVSTLAGVAALLMHFDASTRCIADYDSRSVIIGRAYTPDSAEYVRLNPGLSASDLLLDAGGVPDRVWAVASIRSCRFWLSWGGLSAVPLFAGSVCALIVRRGYRFAGAPRSVAAGRSQGLTSHLGSAAMVPAVYDAFLSYRHAEPDTAHACEILEALESRGLRVAIDFRDFRPNEHFVSEMERCIKESRFVLCVVTSRYLDSDHCSEEAIISKTLDLADRRRRLVPLIFERVELPVWLHGLVGIDFTPSATVDPLERLLACVSRETAATSRHS